MECLSPLSIVNPKGKSTADRISVPCGKCFHCLSNRRDSWSFRLGQELKVSTSAHFVTMTYDDIHLPLSPEGIPIVNKKHIQDFMKRLRKSIEPSKIRYFIVSEYGSNTLRPHYHMLLFNFPAGRDLVFSLEQSWSFGFCSVGTVNGASIHYCTKYCLSFNDLPEPFSSLYKPFMLCSRKPAIGSNYLTDSMIAWHGDDDRTFVVQDGRKINMPRYYRDKVFVTEEQKLSVSRKNDALRSAMYRKYDDSYSAFDAEAVSHGRATMDSQKKIDSVRRFSKLLKTKSKF